MIYDSSSHWLGAQHKRVMLFGMSGLGKTHVSSLLRGSGNWFHYSVDYRIGTRYMGENIADNFKQIAMQNPELRDLLLSDSIYIASNITFDNLTPLSTYLGKPGDQSKGGLPFAEYLRRQEQHRQPLRRDATAVGHARRREARARAGRGDAPRVTDGECVHGGDADEGEGAEVHGASPRLEE